MVFGQLALYIFCESVLHGRVQELIKQKRLEKEEKEKQEQVRLEKLRRSQGKELAAMRQKSVLRRVDQSFIAIEISRCLLFS